MKSYSQSYQKNDVTDLHPLAEFCNSFPIFFSTLSFLGILIFKFLTF